MNLRRLLRLEAIMLALRSLWCRKCGTFGHVHKIGNHQIFQCSCK